MDYTIWKGLHDDLMMCLFFEGGEKCLEIETLLNRIEKDYPHHQTKYLIEINRSLKNEN